MGPFPPLIGGPATYSYELARRLKARGHEVCVLTFGKPKKEGVDKIIVIRTPRSRVFVKRYFDLLLLALKVAPKYDIIYAQDPVSIGLPAAIAKKLSKKPLVTKIVGDFAWEISFQKGWTSIYIEDFQKSKKALITRFLCYAEKFVAKTSDEIVVPCNYLKKLIVGWGIPSEKITVIPNAIDLQSYVNNGGVVKESLGLSNFRVILTVGRLVPWKGVDVLIKIMPEIRKAIPKILLVIIGDGPEMPKLRKLARAYGVADSVIFTGRLERNLVQKYMKSSDVFVIFSKYEGMSHTILEAMACGTPVIASNVCGNPEIIKDSVNGFLVNNLNELKEKILSILSHPENMEKIRQNALDTLKQYSWKRHLNELEEVFFSHIH